jgi:hypothetical protein
MDADHGQTELFRSYLKSRPAFWGLLIGVSATFLYGASKSDPLIMAAGPSAVVVAVVGIAWFVADRMAAQRFYTTFARNVGLAYTTPAHLPPLTPLLGAGNRRRLEHWMHGRLPGELAGGVGHLVWERIERDSEGNEHVRERHRFTVCVVDLPVSMSMFRGIYLQPRRGVFAPHSDWLKRARARGIEVESSDFTARYELRLAEDQDEVTLRRLLSPTLVSWLANHPLVPGFELKAGALCVYVPNALTDAGNLTFLIDATRHLAAKVLSEVDGDKLRAA